MIWILNIYEYNKDVMFDRVSGLVIQAIINRIIGWK